MEYNFDEIQFVPDVVPDVLRSEQLDTELDRLIASCEFQNNYLTLCDEVDDEGEKP